jgi:hypothetical protein
MVKEQVQSVVVFILRLGDHLGYTLFYFHAPSFLFMLEGRWGLLKGQFGMSQTFLLGL